MWIDHTEYDEYQKLQLFTVVRYQLNNTLGKISSVYRYPKISISHTPSSMMSNILVGFKNLSEKQVLL